MIGRVRGILLEKQPPELLVDVSGIAYEISVSMNTFYQLPDLGCETILYTHFVVREDVQQLYGFSEQQERGLFRQLIKISGIGPKVALSILSSIATHEFVYCIQTGDSARLVKIPGIGKKTAERLIIEMRDRLKDWEMPATGDGSEQSAPSKPTSAVEEAASALVALGYKSKDAERAVKQVNQDNCSSAQLIRLALQGMN